MVLESTIVDTLILIRKYFLQYIEAGLRELFQVRKSHLLRHQDNFIAVDLHL
jgi:hypothetical protein